MIEYVKIFLKRQVTPFWFKKNIKFDSFLKRAEQLEQTSTQNELKRNNKLKKGK